MNGAYSYLLRFVSTAFYLTHTLLDPHTFLTFIPPHSQLHHRTYIVTSNPGIQSSPLGKMSTTVDSKDQRLDSSQHTEKVDEGEPFVFLAIDACSPYIAHKVMENLTVEDTKSTSQASE